MATNMRFGPFCREKRTALGLALREFCRRNAFDPGNISRVERGILPPPQSAEGLEAYAKALRLQPDSDDWLTMLELAAAETLQSSSPLLEDETKQQQLPALLRNLRPRATFERPWVTSPVLDNWANYRDAQAQFPQLIRRLVLATNSAIDQIDFPAGEGIQHRGWDGIVVTRDATPFVPAGITAWELGTGTDPKRKFDDDYRRRTKNPLGITPADTTFILVTPRRWHGKGEWERAKTALGDWRRVAVYDADTIESWLELAPAVDMWLARIIGKRPDGTHDIDEHWQNLTSITVPPLTPDVFLASRKKEGVAIESWLSDAPSALAIETRSPIEAIDFFAAYLASIIAEKRDPVAARTIIIETLDAWNVMADEPRSLNLIPAPGLALHAELVAKAVRQGHRVLMCAPRFTNGPYRKLSLSRPSRFDLDRALLDAGFDRGIIEKAEDCGGSLSVLKRRLARFPATLDPIWSQPGHSDHLAFLTLLGRWNESLAGDRAVIEELAGLPYADVAKAVQRWSQEIDPPIFRLSNEWQLTSREDSWLLLNRYLTPGQIDTWQQLAIKVLCHDDPRLDLPERERPFAGLSGKTSIYSESLRTGIAETLAIMATLSADYSPTIDQTRVDRVVAMLFAQSPDWKRWASLSDQLPLLAEASPDAFLAALETDLRQQSPETAKLLIGSNDLFFSRCMHADLLWSLETLAWGEQHLLRSSLVLANLAELDPGGKWVNRPIQSLTEIFMPWLPQTTVPVAARIKSLQVLAKRHPKAGWTLLLNVLESATATSSPTPQPKWRNWTVGNWPRAVADAECLEQLEACGDFVLNMVGTSAARWTELIKRASVLPKTCRSAAVDQLLTLDKTVFPVDGLKQLTEALREQIRRNSDHPDAPWAISTDDVDRLTVALSHLQPDDAVARHSWIFARWPNFPGNPVTVEADDERNRRIADARQSAVSEIFREQGFQGVTILAATVDDEQSAWIVGEALSRAKLVDDSQIIPDLLIDPSPRNAALARGFAHECIVQYEWNWIERQQVQHWTPPQIVGLASVLAPRMQTWQLVESHSPDTKKLYWETTRGLFGIREASDIQYAVTALLERQRPFAAAEVLANAVIRKQAVDANQVAAVLEAGLHIEIASVADRPADLRHALETLIEFLQSADRTIEPQRLVALEFGYLAILDGHPVSAVTLHRALSLDAKFFVDVIRSAFHPKHASDEERQDDDDERHRSVAANAYRVLHSWDRIPGERDDGTIDEPFLQAWLHQVRTLCRESDHLEIGDMQIGEVFAQSHDESDGSWPQISIRDAIEEVNSDAMIEGFIVGTLNSRGATQKSPFEGGEQERRLSEKYEQLARRCDSEWPVTARALRAIAQNYFGRASREDDEAEARRLGR